MLSEEKVIKGKAVKMHNLNLYFLRKEKILWGNYLSFIFVTFKQVDKPVRTNSTRGM